MSSTQARERTFVRITQAIALLFSGAAIGWFIGLSLSPVLHIVVTSILAAAVTAVTAMAGLEGGDPNANATPQESAATSSNAATSPALVPLHRRVPRRLVTLVPLTLLLLGIVSGASFGTYARSHDWFAADPQSLIRKWRVTKLSDDEIAKRLFDQLYPPYTRSTSTDAGGSKSDEQGSKGKSAEPTNHDNLTGRLTGGLFSGVPPEECKEFRSAPNNDLRRFMLGSKSEGVRNFAKRCNDVACLRAAVEELLCTDQRP
jgi:hypothetical protein